MSESIEESSCINWQMIPIPGTKWLDTNHHFTTTTTTTTSSPVSGLWAVHGTAQQPYDSVPLEIGPGVPPQIPPASPRTKGQRHWLLWNTACMALWPHCLFPVCLTSQQQAEYISEMNLLWQLDMLPHHDKSCSSNIPSHPVTVHWPHACQGTLQHMKHKKFQYSGMT